MVRLGRLISWLAVVSAVFGCSSTGRESHPVDVVNASNELTYTGLADPATKVPALLSIDDFMALQAESSNVALIDVRKPNDYAAGHLASARQIWRSDIESPNYAYPGMGIERDALQALLQAKGVRANDHIVLYDGVGGCDAARLWWLLTSYGCSNVSLLDGGWKAWEQQNLPVETAAFPDSVMGDFRFADAPTTALSVNYTELRERMATDSVVVLDTRSMDEFTGTTVKDGALYGGHIPGSVHYDWGNAIDMINGCRLKPEADLRAQLEALGVRPEYHIVVYCHSGVRAAHTAYVLKELLGYPRVSNYDGSWIEWTHLTAEAQNEVSTSNQVH